MSTTLIAGVFTKTVAAGTSFAFTGNYGILKASISCLSTSSASGTILGGISIGGVSSDAISIEAGQSVSVVLESNAIDDVVVSAPSGCTLSIIATKN